MADHTYHIGCLITPDNDMEAYAARENRRYEEALRRYWRAHPRPLAADGLSYHRRCLARRRGRSR